jgi:hypothetical protein
LVGLCGVEANLLIYKLYRRVDENEMIIMSITLVSYEGDEIVFREEFLNLSGFVYGTV